MRVLNLFCGVGGNRKLWPSSVSVTAVESDPKIAAAYHFLFPDDEVIHGDAYELIELADQFDFVWSSPPCQSHSRMVRATRHAHHKPIPDLRLYEQILWLQQFHNCWVVENVRPYYKPLIAPSAVIGRHLFWSNSFLWGLREPLVPSLDISSATISVAEELKDQLGLKYEGQIYYDGNHDPCQVLRNCVHPEIGLAVFEAITRNL